jgi:hypothetical protein
MAVQILSTYYVGQGLAHKEINNVINIIKSALDTGDYSLPVEDEISIIVKGSGLFAPIRIPDNTTPALAAAGKTLVISREEKTQYGQVISDVLPVIDPNAPGASGLSIEQKLIGINIGDNNPNVTIQGLRVRGFVIGIAAGFNCDSLTLIRNFVTNCINAQIYVHDCDGVYVINNVLVGGQFGAVLKFCKKLRVYHNTVYLDGITALDNTTKAGLVLQAERDFPADGSASTGSTLYCIGNLVYTIGAASVVFYEEDINQNRLVSNFNDFYSTGTVIQINQDNAQIAEGETVVSAVYLTLADWRNSGIMTGVGDGNGNPLLFDNNSISIHPLFIQQVDLFGGSNSSLLDLRLLSNSPLLGVVPNLNYDSLYGESLVSGDNSAYVPDDLLLSLIASDSLLGSRQIPLTSIGANDAVSVNGFFGQDIFTSPLLINPDTACDTNALMVLAAESLEMMYPALTAGYFWSNERPYFLYAKKGSGLLGKFAKTTFALPGIVQSTNLSVKVNNQVIDLDYIDHRGTDIIIYHTEYGLTTWDDEVEIWADVPLWDPVTYSFSTTNVYYVFTIRDAIVEFCLPPNYVPGAPVCITDDRISYRNPEDVCSREFTAHRYDELERTKLRFQGNENLLDNGDFTEHDDFTPSYWEAEAQGSDASVFMLSHDFSYWGEHAVGLRLHSGSTDGTSAGWLRSQKISLKHENNLTFSWHAKIPKGLTNAMTYVIGEPITGLSSATGHYSVQLYDVYDEPIEYSLAGTFDMITDSFRRYYITLGETAVLTDDEPPNLLSAPLSSPTSYEKFSIPTEASYAELLISGHNYGSDINPNAFMVLDAVQAEHSAEPSIYHPKPSFVGMTVEYETSDSGVFVDTRLNITPVSHENPNGFVYIIDMPAKLWGGPSNIETTTLHEYRWPQGRLLTMPWSRLWGKDKLRQKVYKQELTYDSTDIIELFNVPRKVGEISLNPDQVRVPQGVPNEEENSKDGFHVSVKDDIGNPYCLRQYSMSVHEKNGQFPGHLSQTYLGINEQLGGTVFGRLSSAGGMNATYIPPPYTNVQWVGTCPGADLTVSGQGTNTDRVTYIVTNYEVNDEGIANVSLQRSNGTHVDLYTDTISGYYEPSSDGASVSLALEYPPKPGTLHIYDSPTGQLWEETYTLPSAYEYWVNHRYATVKLPPGYLSSGNSLYVEYTPSYMYPDPVDSSLIWIHADKINGIDFGGGQLVNIKHDALIRLEASIEQAIEGEIVKEFPIVLQNPNVSLIENTELAQEY